MADDVDLEFFFDPICPFAWLTSRWALLVAGERGLSVRWRFICLRIVNEETDYSKFPPAYPSMHELGRDLLRVAAATRDAAGNEAVGSLYTAMGNRLHHEGVVNEVWRGGEPPAGLVGTVLADAGLDPALAEAAADAGWDAVLREETDLALARTGKDVGTPILTFAPGTDEESSFFGPVISRVPERDQALALYDAVRTLAATRGFAELKRSLRDPLEL